MLFLILCSILGSCLVLFAATGILTPGDVHFSQNESPKKLLLLFLVLSGINGLSMFRLLMKQPEILPCLKGLSALFLCEYAAFCDLRERRIPNRAVLLLFVFRTLLLVPEYAGIGASSGRSSVLSDLLSAGAVFIVLFLFSFFSGGKLGMGDVKLCVVLCFTTGFTAAAFSFGAGVLIAAVSALVLLLSGRKKLQDSLAFAPFLYAGMLCQVFFDGG